ncbi:MAG: FGGY family carbohydrate kinase, partial [bacterium]|nr:FGGY family carbohydrate kinase [bacterium]
MKERTTVRYLGVDIGTTTVTALGMEVETGEVVSVQTAANACEITTVADRKRGRSEWDAKRMAELTQEVIGRAAAETGEVAGIGVTGQMHGMLLVSEKGDPIGPFVGWQDRRGMEPMPGGDGSYVDRMRAVAQEVGAKGCRPTSGYLGTTLFWLAQQGFLPDEAFTASFLPDYIVAVLTGSRPVTDATDAAGTGLYDVLEGDWHTELIEALGLSEKWLSEVLASGTRVGGLTRTVAAFTELPEGLPVFVACGDNQASFAGSVRVYENSLLVNVGTGGQVSAHVERALSAEGLEARPFMDGAFLMVGAGLVGGRSYAWLRDFFREVGGAFFGGQSDEDLYEQMNKLAAGTPSG